jgi:hypothetical protein
LSSAHTEHAKGTETELTPEEIRELIPAHIAYRLELNEAEQKNIARAQDWALNRRRDPLTDKFGAVRQRYIAALQAADNHDFVPLVAFARS